MLAENLQPYKVEIIFRWDSMGDFNLFELIDDKYCILERSVDYIEHFPFVQVYPEFELLMLLGTILHITSICLLGSKKIREPEKIFEGENIVKYSKTLVVEKISSKRHDLERRLTGELIELTQEIEKLRRDSSLNFEKLNQEFEQVRI